MDKANLQKSSEQIDFFKEKQNLGMKPKFLALSIYTLANKITIKNIIAVGAIAIALTLAHQSVEIYKSVQSQNVIKEQKLAELNQLKFNEKIQMVKLISKMDFENILAYMDKTMIRSEQYKQETLYFIDFFDKNDNLRSSFASTYNAENAKEFEVAKLKIQNRKELISKVYEQVQNGFTNTLPIFYDNPNLDSLDVFLTWKEMSNQNTEYVPENLTKVRSDVFSFGPNKMIEAQSHVADMMKKYNANKNVEIISISPDLDKIKVLYPPSEIPLTPSEQRIIDDYNKILPSDSPLPTNVKKK